METPQPPTPQGPPPYGQPPPQQPQQPYTAPYYPPQYGGGGYPAQPPPMPPPPKKPVRWPIVVGVLLVGLVFAGVGVAQAVGALRGSSDDAREVVGHYYTALSAHDWQTAQGDLDAQLRAQTPPATLAATWTQREAAYGMFQRFDVAGYAINSTNGVTTAKLTTTVRYKSGASEPKEINLIKENGVWKLASMP